MDTDFVKIYYLYHSGFAVDIDEYFLVFDYYNDESDNNIRDIRQGVIDKDTLKNKENILVFVSHGHHDHWNPVVLNWKKERKDIEYFISDDIKNINPVQAQNYNFLSPYQEMIHKGIKIKTYGSTDKGVSFLIDINGISLFHGGDLNYWYWYYKMTPQELVDERTIFTDEVDRIKGEKIDIAFFPVDPRLKEYFYLGGEYFIQVIKPKMFIPMHFGNDYYITRRFADKMTHMECDIMEITHRGQEIIYNKKK